MSASNVEQLNQNFCLRLHQKLSQRTKTTKNVSRGACPQTPLNRNKKCCPPTFHDLPTPLHLTQMLTPQCYHRPPGIDTGGRGEPWNRPPPPPRKKLEIQNQCTQCIITIKARARARARVRARARTKARDRPRPVLDFFFYSLMSFPTQEDISVPMRCPP